MKCRSWCDHVSTLPKPKFGTEILKENIFNLQVITDPVDKRILKMFEEEAKKLLNVGRPSVKKVTGVDPKDKKVVQGEIRIEVKAPPEVIGDYSGITFTIGE